MCVLWAAYKDRPSEYVLRSGFERNSDGAGIAWIEGKNVRWIKGYDDGKLFAEEVKHLPLPFIAHCRLASIGGNSLSLTHPFPLEPDVSTALEGKAKRVLAHNGHWNNYDVWLKDALFAGAGKLKIAGGDWSDTRVMAWLAQTYGVGILSTLPSHNKIAVLDGNLGNFSDFYGKDWFIGGGKDNDKGYYQSSAVSVSDYCKTSSYDTKGAPDPDPWESNGLAQYSHHRLTKSERRELRRTKQPMYVESEDADGVKTIHKYSIENGKMVESQSKIYPAGWNKTKELPSSNNASNSTSVSLVPKSLDDIPTDPANRVEITLKELKEMTGGSLAFALAD